MKYFGSFNSNVTRAISCLTLMAAVLNVSFSSGVYAVEKGPSSAAPAYPDWKQTVMELRGRRLTMPIDGYDPEQMKGAFYQGRVGHVHRAADLVAPRNTPIRTVEDGTIGRLFESAAGGLTIYQKDPSGRFVYYYAHLENYAEGLKDGDSVKRGQVIGYVGTSGNAPPDTPHLHFSISVIAPGNSFFKGAPVDPYEVYSKDVSVVGKGSFSVEEDQKVRPDATSTKSVEKPMSRNSSIKEVIKTENKPLSVKSKAATPSLKPTPSNRQTAAAESSKMPPLIHPPTKLFPEKNQTGKTPTSNKKVKVEPSLSKTSALNKQAANAKPPKPATKAVPSKASVKAHPSKLQTKSSVKKTTGSTAAKKNKVTPKSNNTKKLTKSSTPQKTSIVLRKQNKPSTTPKRTAH